MRKERSKRLLKAIEDLLGEINVLPFDVPADAEYGAIRSELDAAGRLWLRRRAGGLPARCGGEAFVPPRPNRNALAG
jgi:predicted nucleic acid-binding protein